MIVENWMHALATGDQDLFWRVHADDVVYNMSGHTIISGQMRGKKGMMEEIVPHVFGGLAMDGARFASKWKIMCDDGTRAMISATCISLVSGADRLLRSGSFSIPIWPIGPFLRLNMACPDQPR
jgi:hypothetical protein